MARVLCLSSKVARGHIGLSATVTALEALGHDAIAIPTVMLSNHPGHQAFAKLDVSASFITDSIEVFDKAGWLSEIDAVMSGYLPSEAHVAAVRNTILKVQVANPKAIFLADPVLGDDPAGLYVLEAAAQAVRDQLVPLANYITPNRFEASWLSGVDVTTEQRAIEAANALRSALTVVTSVPSHAANELSNVLATANTQPLSFRTQRWTRVPHGTGDLFAGLFLGHLLNGLQDHDAVGRAVSGVALVAADSSGCDELDLTKSRAKWLEPEAVSPHII